MGVLRTVVVTVVVIVVVGACAGYVALRNGFAADRPPTRVEAAIARRLVRLSIPSSTQAMANPHANDPDAWREGGDHFMEHCAVCHGDDGHGQSELGPKMYPPVPDLGARDVQDLSDGALFAIIQNGVRWTGMPGFRSEHSADETWKLVAFVRHVPQLHPSAAHH